MSHFGNTTILEQHFENALELTRFELIQELAMHAGQTASHGQERALFRELLHQASRRKLLGMVANKRFAEGPSGPC